MANPTIVVQRSAYTGFDEDQPQYKCCCGCMHVKTGAIIIGVLEILGALANIGGLIGQHVQGKSTGLQGSIYYGLVGAGITILVVILLFVGIAQESHPWVIPHLVFQIIGIIALIVGGIILIVLLAISGAELQNGKIAGIRFDYGTNDVIWDKNVIWGLLIFTIIMLLIIAIFEIWWFVVILKFYRYCRDKKYSTSSATVVQYGNQQYGNQQQISQPLYSQQYANQGYAKYP